MPETPQPDLTVDGLAHDLNNVLETIADAARLLSRDPKYARLAATIHRGAARGTRILSSYVEQSQASLDADLILDAAIEFVRDFLDAVKGPHLEFVRRVEPGLRLRGNPAAWERVFVNLFLNAAQAMGEEDGTVEIEAARSASIEITVRDDGPGISSRILPNIFDPGFSTRAKRSGLGMHIVKTIVDRYGGSITASNCSTTRGAQFQILPPDHPDGTLFLARTFHYPLLCNTARFTMRSRALQPGLELTFPKTHGTQTIAYSAPNRRRQPHCPK